MGKFVVKATKTGFVFNLKAGNGEVIATSEIYTTEATCMKGVESVRKNAADAKLEDLTVAEVAAVTNPKFELYTDKAGEFRFRLKARQSRPHDSLPPFNERVYIENKKGRANFPGTALTQKHREI